MSRSNECDLDMRMIRGGEKGEGDGGELILVRWKERGGEAVDIETEISKGPQFPLYTGAQQEVPLLMTALLYQLVVVLDPMLLTFCCLSFLCFPLCDWLASTFRKLQQQCQQQSRPTVSVDLSAWCTNTSHWASIEHCGSRLLQQPSTQHTPSFELRLPSKECTDEDQILRLVTHSFLLFFPAVNKSIRQRSASNLVEARSLTGFHSNIQGGESNRAGTLMSRRYLTQMLERGRRS